MGFLDWLLGKGGEVCDGDPRLAEAVARVIDATDPRLRLLDGVRERLCPAVTGALAYADRVAAARIWLPALIGVTATIFAAYLLTLPGRPPLEGGAIAACAALGLVVAAVARRHLDRQIAAQHSWNLALKNLLANPEWKGRAGLTANARVLLISTEGATAPRVFENIVGRSHEAVALAQKEWLKQRAPDGFHGRSIA